MKKASSVAFLFLALLTAACQSTHSKLPTPYHETFSEDLKTAREASARTVVSNSQFKYVPGVVRATSLDRIQNTPAGTQIVMDEYIVQLKTGLSPDDLLKDLQTAKIAACATGFVPTFSLVQLRLMDASDYKTETIEKIRGLRSVQNVFPHFIRSAQQFVSNSRDWHVSNYGIDQVWRSNRGEGITIAILDSGMDTSLVQWDDRIVAPYSVITRSSVFEDGEVRRGGDVLRVIDHGTRVASVAAANSRKGETLLGIAPGARIMPIQILGFHVSNEQVYTNDLTVIEGIARGMAMGAQIINLSVGTDYARAIRETPLPAKQAAMLREIYRESLAVKALYDAPFAEANRLNVWIVTASGNSSSSTDWEPLASHPYVISIGAIDSADHRAAFTNFGEAVMSYAPGVGVPTLVPGGQILASSGTSFSAPYVSGVLALLRSGRPDLQFDEVKRRLKESNLTVRSTILYGAPETPLFDPVGLLRKAGLNLSIWDNPKVRARQFMETCADIMIERTDSEEIQLQKILEYYTRRWEYYSTDMEARAALPLIPKYFNITRNKIEHGLDFYVANLIADSALSDEQVAYARSKLLLNDYIVIIVMRHDGQLAYNQIAARLNLRDTFNGNTVRALVQIERPDTHERLVTYLRMLHEQKTWREDEAATMLAIVATNNQLRETTRQLLLKSHDRYRQSFEGLSRARLVDRHIVMVSESLIRAGYPEGIDLALDGTALIEERLQFLREHPEETYARILENSAETIGYRLQELQTLINEHIDSPVKYNYMYPLSDRDLERKAIHEFLKNTRYANGKFVASRP